MLGYMAKNNNDKPFTIKDIHEVFIPAMEEVFATKKDLEKFATKKDLGMYPSKQDLKDLEFRLNKVISKKFDKVLTRSDKILKDLTTLMTEKTVRNYQKEKERKLWAIMIDAMRQRKILSTAQLKTISELEIF